MRAAVVRGGLPLCVLCALLPAGASGQPVSGPRETVDQTFTTPRPHTPAGAAFSATYHAAGNPQGNPPYLKRMIFNLPRGMRYDTSVPDRCTASDIELEARGPAACPPGSRLGTGTAEGLFLVPFAHDVTFDHYKHNLYMLNNANEQILLVESEGFTVQRGHIRPDGSLEFVTTTCFPAPPAGGCADDYILQLKSSTALAPYTRRSNGRLRSYLTTPAKCPARRYWRTTVRYWWADGSKDNVVTRQPCRRRR